MDLRYKETSDQKTNFLTEKVVEPRSSHLLQRYLSQVHDDKSTILCLLYFVEKVNQFFEILYVEKYNMV